MDNIITKIFDKLFKHRKSSSIQRSFSGDFTDSYFDELSVLKNDFRFAFSFLVFSVNMNRFMLIGVEQDNQTEVFIKFGHDSDSSDKKIIPKEPGT